MQMKIPCQPLSHTALRFALALACFVLWNELIQKGMAEFQANS
jgi:hypothetical protein